MEHSTGKLDVKFINTLQLILEFSYDFETHFKLVSENNSLLLLKVFPFLTMYWSTEYTSLSKDAPSYYLVLFACKSQVNRKVGIHFTF